MTAKIEYDSDGWPIHSSALDKLDEAINRANTMAQADELLEDAETQSKD